MFYDNYYNYNNSNCCSIRETLMKIDRLQREAIGGELQEGCARDVLGEDNICNLVNTRPITCYTRENNEMSFPTERRDSGCQRGQERSCVFRVECVNEDSVQCRILVEGQSSCGRPGYQSTNSFITLRLEDISCIRCLPDTFVDLCIR